MYDPMIFDAPCQTIHSAKGEILRSDVRRVGGAYATPGGGPAKWEAKGCG